ncbi:hypothetical protein F5051DRAFT_148766 [Lentinula edodes]|nr:hypothetical protein F5051DRAFT_148766 [Lentinula edodes]
MSKVVFVGNVPYNMGEEQLIDVFKSVGQVVGFRLVFDRDTGKPKGYGFCEFTDHETASSAVRNLNNYEVGGRPLRIDLADSDPFLEGKTTVRGELLDGGGPSDRQWRSDNTNKSQDFLASLPPGIPVPAGSTVLDTISQTLATMNPSQLMDVLAHMKAFVITHPEQARTLLVSHPQFAYALFQALLLNKIVDQSILQRMLAATVGSTVPPSAPTPANVPPQQYYPPGGNYGASSHMPPFPPNMATPMFAAPPVSMPPPNYYRPTPPPGMTPSSQMQHPSSGSSTPVLQQPSPVQANMYQRAQPQANNVAALNNISESHKALLRQVVSMSDEQVNALPETERIAILQLRSQFGNAISV